MTQGVLAVVPSPYFISLYFLRTSRAPLFATVQKDPPKPRDAVIHTLRVPAVTLYASSFGGFATEQAVLQYAAQMAADLKAAGTEVSKKSFWFASYDPPYRYAPTISWRFNNFTFIIPCWGGWGVGRGSVTVGTDGNRLLWKDSYLFSNMRIVLNSIHGRLGAINKWQMLDHHLKIYYETGLIVTMHHER